MLGVAERDWGREERKVCSESGLSRGLKTTGTSKSASIGRSANEVLSSCSPYENEVKGSHDRKRV